MRKLTMMSAAALGAVSFGAHAAITDGHFSMTATVAGINPIENQLDYALTDIDGLNPSLEGQKDTIRVGFRTGYEGELAYILPCANNDLTLRYSTFRHDFTDSVDDTNGRIWNTLLPASWQSAPDMDRVEAKVDYNISDFSIQSGHRYKVGNGSALRFYGGVDYAYLRKDLSTIGFTSGALDTVKYEERYKGVGPMVGLGGHYHAIECFTFLQNVNLFGGANAALLVGQSHDHVTGTGSGTNEMLNVRNHELQMVPRVAGRFGVEVVPVKTESMQVNFALGYKTAYYFDGLKTTRFNDTTNLAHHENDEHSIGDHGVFFSMGIIV